jgi:hypothetical protein
MVRSIETFDMLRKLECFGMNNNNKMLKYISAAKNYGPSENPYRFAISKGKSILAEL